MGCIFQVGASYHASPVMMSILPSLLTSAMVTPSERNFLSRTVFFQVMAGFFLSPLGASARESDERAAAAMPAPSSQTDGRMGCLTAGARASAWHYVPRHPLRQRPTGADGTAPRSWRRIR